MRAGEPAGPAWDPALAPEALLHAVREAGGGVAALAALRRGLRAGELHLVTQQCAPPSPAPPHLHPLICMDNVL